MERNDELVSIEPTLGTLTADQIVARSRMIHKVMKDAMRDGVDYGVITGCGPRPCLLKPGAEKLLMVFQVAAKVSVNDLSTPPDVYRYRVIVSLISQAGVYLGDGVGEATSLEKKWHERKDGSPVNAPDVCNTILKMAKKRALVDAVLTVLGASDIFTQDVDEMDPDTVKQSQRYHKPEPVKKAELEKPRDGDALSTAQLAWFEKNALQVWDQDHIAAWLAAHNVKDYAGLCYGDAKELHRELVEDFEKRTKNEQ